MCACCMLQLRSTSFTDLPGLGESCEFLTFKAVNKMGPHSILIKCDGCNIVPLGGMVGGSNAKQPTVVGAFLLLLHRDNSQQ